MVDLVLNRRLNTRNILLAQGTRGEYVGYLLAEGGRLADPAAFVKADVIMECRRRGLPSPAEVAVLDVRSGPRGGRSAAMLRLRFATAVRGPVLLGRDSHSGGGLFRAAWCRE